MTRARHLAPLLALVLVLAGCGGGSSSSDPGTATQAGEPTAGERGGLLLDSQVAEYNLCIDLGIEPCANEADSLETTEAFIATIEGIAADNKLKPASTAAALREASAELDGACPKCKKLLDDKAASLG